VLKQGEVPLQHPMFKLLCFPDIISMLNGFFGLSAILLLLFDFSLPVHIKFHAAMVLILLGLLADGLDGILARRYRKGELGVYFEAMSDMTTMGITPAVFIAIWFNSNYQQSIILSTVLWALLLFYLCAAFIRLASFHPLKNKQVFLGLPASAATMFLLSISFITTSQYLILLAIFTAACLMILSIKFPKPTKSMNVVTTIIIFLTIFLGFFYTIIYGVLLGSVLFYMVGGQIYIYFSKETKQTLKKTRHLKK
jgi:archaetidylserine synthase